jgi:formylglycine-generating enzyme required for sulfatase activity
MENRLARLEDAIADNTKEEPLVPGDDRQKKAENNDGDRHANLQIPLPKQPVDVPEGAGKKAENNGGDQHANPQMPLPKQPVDAPQGAGALAVANQKKPNLRNAWTSVSTDMDFVRIPGGTFMMGVPGIASVGLFGDDRKPQHEVGISAFYLGTYEVTQLQYRIVMGDNPSYFSSTGRGWEQIAGNLTDNYPVENVSWLDAVRFCNSLSEKDGLKPYYVIIEDDIRIPDLNGSGYRLPTEAEWEYACRAGTTTKFSFGDDDIRLGEYAWYARNSEWVTHPVGQNHANALGLYDMHGNVWEWCWDGYFWGYYHISPDVDPRGRARATERVRRGGDAETGPDACASVHRDKSYRGDRFEMKFGGYRSLYGFRVARGLDAPNEIQNNGWNGNIVNKAKNDKPVTLSIRLVRWSRSDLGGGVSSAWRITNTSKDPITIRAVMYNDEFLALTGKVSDSDHPCPITLGEGDSVLAAWKTETFLDYILVYRKDINFIDIYTDRGVPRYFPKTAEWLAP